MVEAKDNKRSREICICLLEIGSVGFADRWGIDEGEKEIKDHPQYFGLSN